MFGSIGLPELVLIFIVALLLFGPRKLPEIGRTVGKALGEFRRASNDLKRTLEDEVAAADLREVRRDLDGAFQEPVATPVPPAPTEPVVPAPTEPSVQPTGTLSSTQASDESSEPRADADLGSPPESPAGEPR